MNHPQPILESVSSDWSTRVQANGGPAPSLKTLWALQIFVDRLTIADLWSKMLDFVFFPPDSLIAACTPVKVTYGNSLWATNSFTPDLLSVNGLAGQETADYYLTTGINLNKSPAFTGLSPSIFPGLSVYVVDPTSDDEFFEMGTDFFSGLNLATGFSESGEHSSGLAVFDAYGQDDGEVVEANPTFKGFVSGNRTDLAHSALYRANSVKPFETVAETDSNNTTLAAEDSNMVCFGTRLHGDPSRFTNRTLSFAAFHYGLTAGAAENLFKYVQGLRMDLGGGFC